MDVFLASGNSHKFEEFISIVLKLGLKLNLYSADYIGGMPEVEETGSTFEENARIKAEALAKRSAYNSWILSDDSGLMVDALDGRPGVQSARYAGPGANDLANNIKLLGELKGLDGDNRTARFRSVLCFLQVGGECLYFSGDCEGRILTSPSGDQGFGYDPLFLPNGYDKSFAELGSAVKNAISHRGRAVASWIEYLKGIED